MINKLLLLFLLTIPIPMVYGHACSAMITGANFGSGRLNGFRPFPLSSIYTNISAVAADPSSATWISAIGGTLIPQYAPYRYTDPAEPMWWGYTWYVVDGDIMRRQNVYVDAAESYPGDSDSVPGGTLFPIPIPNSVVKQDETSGVLGGSHFAFASFAYPPVLIDNLNRDKHVMIYDKSNCVTYEMWNCWRYGGNLHCGVAMAYDLLAGDHQRPYFWASGSASGAAFTGMLGVASDFTSGTSVGHALPCSMATSGGGIARKAFTGIAQHHQYGNTNNPALAPLGAILRLKPSFNTSIYFGITKSILETFKSHGCVVTDGGNSISPYLELSNGWGSDMSQVLDNHIDVNSTNFDFVNVDRATIYSDSIGGPFPPYTPNAVISSFTATPSGTVASGTAVTLTWSVSNATALRFLYPEIGVLRGPAQTGMTSSGYDLSGLVVHPTLTTTYTLMVQNGGIHDPGGGGYAMNRAIATVCVAVTGSTTCP